MNPVTIKTIPTEGQFVAIWSLAGELFAQTLKWQDGQLMAYDSFNDIWWHQCDHGCSVRFLREKYATYVVL